MDELIKLYAFIDKNKYLVEQITSLDESEFVHDNNAINASYALINETINHFAKLDKMTLIASDKLNYKRGELFSLQNYIVNSYKEVNGYLVYDYLKEEYSGLLEELKEILSL